MKCILLLTFVALCYSYPYTFSNNYGGGRNVNINADGTIIITGEDGKKVTITRSAGVAGKKIDIAVSGPNIPTKRIQIDEQKKLDGVNLLDEDNGERRWSSDDDTQRDKRSSRDSKKRNSQGDTLAEIIREYEGVVDQQSYEQLLKKVNAAVQAGQLSSSIYEVLQSLNQGWAGQKQGLWTPQQQGILTQQVQNQGVVGSFLQKPYSYLDFLKRQAIQQELQQQQVGNYGVPIINALGQQQVVSPYGQAKVNPFETVEGKVIGTAVQDVVLEVPTIGGRKEIIEGILLEDPQVVTYENGQGAGWVQGTPGLSLYDLLNIYGTQGLQQRGVLGQYGQQLGQYGQYGQGAQYGSQQGYGQLVGQYGQPIGQYGQQLGQYGQPIGQYGQQLGQYGQPIGQYGQQLGQIGQRTPVDFPGIVEDKRDILGQQLQQEQQKQLLQQSLQQGWQQQQQQQVQQQLLQQVQQQQLLQQLQQQKNNVLRQYLVNGGSIQAGGQQRGLWQQQLGVYPEGELYGYISQGQGVPMKQRYNVPLVL